MNCLSTTEQPRVQGGSKYQNESLLNWAAVMFSDEPQTPLPCPKSVASSSDPGKALAELKKRNNTSTVQNDAVTRSSALEIPPGNSEIPSVGCRGREVTRRRARAHSRDGECGCSRRWGSPGGGARCAIFEEIGCGYDGCSSLAMIEAISRFGHAAAGEAAGHRLERLPPPAPPASPFYRL
jgi:hypothetical protein